jgi:N6-L-threonylcarbamoyladenine synthase
LAGRKTVKVLGVETSCDETSAAVVRDGGEILSNVVSSQIALHRPYGGVVPELASRNHLRLIGSVIEEALAEAGISMEQIDAIAATYGPGLASSLLIGLNTAKGIAFAIRKAVHRH